MVEYKMSIAKTAVIFLPIVKKKCNIINNQ